MKRIYFLAVPAVVLTASVALGDDGRVAEARAKYSLIDSLRFNENDLAKLERITLTNSTALRWGTKQSATTGVTQPIVAAPVPQWFEPSTQIDSLDGDSELKTPKIGINTPLVRMDEQAIDGSALVSIELADEAATSIPEPESSMALATPIELRVVSRRVRK